MGTLEKFCTSTEEEDSADSMFKNWFAEHGHVFKDIDSDDLLMAGIGTFESKLEYTEAFNSFQEVFEGMLERMVESCEVDVVTFFEALKQNRESDPNS